MHFFRRIISSRCIQNSRSLYVKPRITSITLKQSKYTTVAFNNSLHARVDSKNMGRMFSAKSVIPDEDKIITVEKFAKIYEEINFGEDDNLRKISLTDILKLGVSAKKIWSGARKLVEDGFGDQLKPHGDILSGKLARWLDTLILKQRQHLESMDEDDGTYHQSKSVYEETAGDICFAIGHFAGDQEFCDAYVKNGGLQSIFHIICSTDSVRLQGASLLSLLHLIDSSATVDELNDSGVLSKMSEFLLKEPSQEDTESLVQSMCIDIAHKIVDHKSEASQYLVDAQFIKGLCCILPCENQKHTFDNKITSNVMYVMASLFQTTNDSQTQMKDAGGFQLLISILQRAKSPATLKEDTLWCLANAVSFNKDCQYEVLHTEEALETVIKLLTSKRFVMARNASLVFRYLVNDNTSCQDAALSLNCIPQILKVLKRTEKNIEHEILKSYALDAMNEIVVHASVKEKKKVAETLKELAVAASEVQNSELVNELIVTMKLIAGES